jgi:hypothetical protein
MKLQQLSTPWNSYHDCAELYASRQESLGEGGGGGRGRRRFIRELGYWNQKVHPQGMFMKHGKVNKGAC